MFNEAMYKAKKYGKDKWTYGLLVMVDCRHAIMRDTLIWIDDGSSFILDVHSWDFVDRNTIHIGSQLFDNDDTQIYDGDIIALGDDRYVVVYEDGVFWAKRKIEGEINKFLLFMLMEESLDGVNVVGNKHDDFDMYMKILFQ